jgi:hypothetical protein
MRKGFLIYEDMRKYLTKYEEALVIYDLAMDPFWISLYMKKFFIIFFYQCIVCKADFYTEI